MKPKINLRPTADHYATRRDERIIEVYRPDGRIEVRHAGCGEA